MTKYKEDNADHDGGEPPAVILTTPLPASIARAAVPTHHMVANILILTDGAIPPLIHGVLDRLLEVRTAKGAVVGFCTFVTDIPDHARCGQILFWRDGDLRLLREGAGRRFDVEITQPDPAASAARPGGLRPSGKIVGVGPAPVDPPDASDAVRDSESE